MLPVKPDCVNFIDKRQSVVLAGHFANFFDGGNITGHRVDRLKRDYLCLVLVVLFEECFEMIRVIVVEDFLLGQTVSHPNHHRVVVRRVGEVNAVREHLPERGERCVVCHIARAEDEPGLLAVEFRNLFFQLDVVVAGARYVPSASSTHSILLNHVAESGQNYIIYRIQRTYKAVSCR